LKGEVGGGTVTLLLMDLKGEVGEEAVTLRS
jgi:hypothetical protein